jgi:protein-tyrosine phosphatase
MTEQDKIQWRNGFLWLALLAPLFFILYGWANNYAASLPKESVGEIVYDWEKYIPFLPSTIFPYWSIDLLYGLSLFLPMTKFIQRQHAMRLLVATPIAVLFFCWFPLTFSTPRPECSGIWKVLFDALMGFDKPFNQSPSLHIILLVILWRIYLPHFGVKGKIIWNIWCFLIGISVLTTFQHHFIDIPAGFLTGIIICYLFPLSKEHYWKWQEVRSISLSIIHLIVGALFLVLAFIPPIYIGLIIIWIGFSLIFIGLGYLGLGPIVFQKNENGTFTFAANILFFPYRWMSRFIRSVFFKSYQSPQKITDKLYLGAFWMSKVHDFDAIFDVCSEYKRTKNKAQNYISHPLIDLVTPTINELTIGVEKLDYLIKNNNTVFIHCALGMSRSTTVVFAWLLYTDKIKTVKEGFNFFNQNNYPFNLSDKHEKLLEIYSKKIKND